MASDSVIKVGIIGCGGIMRVHMHGYKVLREAGYDDVRITALCDINPEAIKRYRKRSEGPTPPQRKDPYGFNFVDDFQPEPVPEAYTDHREMLQKADVDAVEIYTSDSSHHSLAIDCIKAGKHVMVEKPMAMTVRAGRRMIEEAEKKGVVLATAQCFRFEEFVRAARFIVEEGMLGATQVVSWCNVGRGVISKMKDRVSGLWRLSKFATSGEAIENGCHFFDTMRYMVGEIDEVLGRVETFEKVRREYDSEGRPVREHQNENHDAFFAIVGFRNGAIGQVSHVNNAHGEALRKRPIKYAIYGNKGCIKEQELVLDDGSRENVNEVLNRQASPESKEQLFPLGLKDRYALETYDFLEAIRKGRRPEVDGGEGLRAIAVGWAVIESSSLGCMVKVDEVESGKVADCQRAIDEHLGVV